MSYVITHRKTSPRPPTFPKGCRVAFAAQDGKAYEGIFHSRYSRRREGTYYLIEVEGRLEEIFANSEPGRSVTQQKGA
jgi:hypothetical protein